MLPLTVGWRKSIVRKRYLVIASIIATPKLCDTFCNCGFAKWSGCQEDLIRAETLWCWVYPVHLTPTTQQIQEQAVAKDSSQHKWCEHRKKHRREGTPSSPVLSASFRCESRCGSYPPRRGAEKTVVVTNHLLCQLNYLPIVWYALGDIIDLISYPPVPPKHPYYTAGKPSA